MPSCEICAKVFSRSDNLKRHHKLHDVKDHHPCPRCGKSFSRSSTLKNHVNEDNCRVRLSSLKMGKRSISSTQVDKSTSKKPKFDYINGSCMNVDVSTEEPKGETDVELGDETNCYESEDTNDGSMEYNFSGKGTKRDIFGGTLEDDVEGSTSGEEPKRDIFGGTIENHVDDCVSGKEFNCETDDGLEHTDDSTEVDAETEERDENKEDTLEGSDDDINEDCEASEEEDEFYEQVIINWPQYNIKKPWQSYGEKIVLFDQLAWLQRMAASQSSLTIKKQIRHATEPQILALCEIALNLLRDHIPMTDEDFNCYKSQKGSLRELAYGDYDWKRNRLLLGSNNTLVWILLVSIEPLYDS